MPPIRVGTDEGLDEDRHRSSPRLRLVRTDQLLWCWGYNGFGQLGLGDAGVAVLVPTRVGTDQGLGGDRPRRLPHVRRGGTYLIVVVLGAKRRRRGLD